MRICIQDPAQHQTYLLDVQALLGFCTAGSTNSSAADVIFVLPSDTLIQELPAARLTDSQTPSVMLVDPERDQSWLLRFEDLKRFVVPVPPSDDEDICWFAMPSAKQVLAAVPVFRKALVQNSS